MEAAPMSTIKYITYPEARQKLIEYLLLKVGEADWHGVSDAANDLRVMEAKHEPQTRTTL
jgi:hypothetical protein